MSVPTSDDIDAMPPTGNATRARDDMRVKLSDLTLETIEHIRRDYADGEPVQVTKSKHNVSDATFYACVDGRVPGHPSLPPIPRRNKRPGKAPESDIRSVLIAKLWRTAKRQVSEIEARLKMVAERPSERESDTRSLAVLVKTVRELAALDEVRDAHNNSTDVIDDDPIPQDIDEFRRELARRMDAFVVARTGPGVPDKS